MNKNKITVIRRENKSRREEQALRLLRWIQKYPGWWHLICTPGDERMAPAMMKMLIQRLKEGQFYEIIFVLLMVHRKAGFLRNILRPLLLELILAGWSGEPEGRERLLQSITDLLT